MSDITRVSDSEARILFAQFGLDFAALCRAIDRTNPATWVSLQEQADSLTDALKTTTGRSLQELWDLDPHTGHVYRPTLVTDRSSGRQIHRRTRR